MTGLLIVRRPAWAAGLLAVIVFMLACTYLGLWQWHRKQRVEARNDRIEANYDRSPVGLTAVLESDGAVSPAAEWTPVAVGGRYLPGTVVAVRNRPQDGRPGYLVTAVLQLDQPVAGRDTLWVVRGWVSADVEDPAGELAAPPVGDVGIVARVRPSEPGIFRRGPPHQAYRVTPDDLALAAGGLADPGAAVDGYAVLAADPATDPGAGLTPLPEPGRDPGPHLAYSVQWWLFAAGALATYVLYYRRAATASGDGDAAAARSAGSEGRDTVAASGTGRTRGSREDPWRYDPGG